MARAYKAISAVTAAGAAAIKDIDVGTADSLLVVWLVTDAAAVTDLGATSVLPFTVADDVAPGILINNGIPAAAVAASSLSGSTASKIERYDVRGLVKTRLSLTNAAATARTLQAHVYLDN